VIYFGATGIDSYDYDGRFDADPPSTSSDMVLILQGSHAQDLEDRINAEGANQLDSAGRALGGYQIAAGGKGNVATVMLYFTRAQVNGMLDTNFRQDREQPGVRVFLWKANSEAELAVQEQAALQRAIAFVGGASTPFEEWLGYEMAGGCDGGEYWGMMVIRKGGGG
jgi:hypothetical protein